MYLEYFQLREKPFRIAPDPAYFFFSTTHREALAALNRGIDERCGLLMLLGEVGTGKTTLCRLVQERRGCISIYVGNPFLSPGELLEALQGHLGPAKGRGDGHDRLEQLRRYLLLQHTSGKTVVLFIDEAHRLALPLLEQVLVLSNLQNPDAQLLQVVLVGQSELLEILSHPQLASLNQRIGVRYHLKGLDRDDTRRYVLHRLKKAGCAIEALFTHGALDAVWRASGGRPRLINLLCERALVETYRRGKRRVGRREVAAVVGDPLHRTLFGTRLRRLILRPTLGSAVMGLSLAVTGVLAIGYGWTRLAPAGWPGAGFGQERVTLSRRPIPPLQVREGADGRKGGRVQIARHPIPAAARGDRLLNEEEAPQLQEERRAPRLADRVGGSTARKRYAQRGSSRDRGDDAIALLTVAKVGRDDDGEVVVGPVRQKVAEMRSSLSSTLPPPFTLSAIAWDEDPRRRFVVLNESILHEGEFLGETRVLRIHEDHVVLLNHNEQIIERIYTRDGGQ
ncbi:MAG TPA: AAA family ATPase [Syntrophobacteria bacterium]|nr:AAA family ATPase [Syntrophobacteria bacterium]